jgi:hypothetical protein
MKKLIFITLLISISTVLSFAQEAKKTNSEVTGSQTNEKQKQWLPSNFRAISEVPVTLLTPAGDKVQSATTNTQGEFNFTNVVAGKYVVAIGKYDVKNLKGLNHTVISPRDAASGLATGRREAGSGMATGRRQYEPLLIRKRIDKATPLLAKTSGAVAIPISAPNKDDVCDDDCDGFIEVTLGFGEKVNAGLHAAGGALAQGASLLGGSVPGGSILSSALTIQQGIEIKETGDIAGNIMMRQQINKSKSNVKNN